METSGQSAEGTRDSPAGSGEVRGNMHGVCSSSVPKSEAVNQRWAAEGSLVAGRGGQELQIKNNFMSIKKNKCSAPTTSMQIRAPK